MDQYQFSGNLRKNPDGGRRKILVLFLATGLISVGLVVMGRWWGKEVNGGTDKNWWGGVKISYIFDQKKEENKNVTGDKLVQQLVEPRAGKWGVYVYNLKTKQEYGWMQDQALPAMSIMKVPIMIATYKAIEHKKLNEDAVYDFPVTTTDPNATAGATPTIVVTRMSIRRMMQEIGKRSDNTAPVILTRLVGKEAMRQNLSELGMKKSDFDLNTTTASDVGLMWRKLYDNQAGINLEHTDEMFGFLTDSIYEDRIPAGVPKEVKVVHKVGTDEDVWADSGIAIPQSTSPNSQIPIGNPLVIVILNDEVDLEKAKTDVVEVVRGIWEGENTP